MLLAIRLGNNKLCGPKNLNGLLVGLLCCRLAGCFRWPKRLKSKDT